MSFVTLWMAAWDTKPCFLPSSSLLPYCYCCCTDTVTVITNHLSSIAFGCLTKRAREGFHSSEHSLWGSRAAPFPPSITLGCFHPWNHPGFVPRMLWQVLLAFIMYLFWFGLPRPSNNPQKHPSRLKHRPNTLRRSPADLTKKKKKSSSTAMIIASIRIASTQY